MKKMNKKGFTIVELVIVIAVIGILASVLIPTFSDVVENAKASAALQNARNAYTEYCACHAASGDVDVDYVKIGDVYYDVEDGFAAETTAPTSGNYIVEDNSGCTKCGYKLNKIKTDSTTTESPDN